MTDPTMAGALLRRWKELEAVAVAEAVAVEEAEALAGHRLSLTMDKRH
jgi:hypothetical protein